MKFWGVKSLVGFRYGKDHHAIVGGFVVHVPDENAPGRLRQGVRSVGAAVRRCVRGRDRARPARRRSPGTARSSTSTRSSRPRPPWATTTSTSPRTPPTRRGEGVPDPGHRDPGARRARTGQGRSRPLRRRGAAQGQRHEHRPSRRRCTGPKRRSRGAMRPPRSLAAPSFGLRAESPHSTGLSRSGSQRSVELREGQLELRAYGWCSASVRRAVAT